MIKVLILAAGKGSRLSPITNTIPKPLIAFAGPTMLDLAIFRALQIRPKAIAVNTHHLADNIHNHIKTHWQNQGILVSHEKFLQDTGGAISKILPWLGNDHLVILNADIVSDLCLNNMLTHHLDTQAYATMAIIEYKHGTTPLYRHGSKLLSIGHTQSQTHDKPISFSGIHILSPQFLKHLPKQAIHSIITTYQNVIRQKKNVQTFFHEGFWADIGSPRALFQAYCQLVTSYNQKIDHRLGLRKMGTKIGRLCRIDTAAKHILPASMPEKPNWGANTFCVQSWQGLLPRRINNAIILEETKISHERLLENIILTRHEMVDF